MQYTQMQSYVTILIKRKRLRVTLSKLEMWLKTGGIWEKSLSKVYGLMLEESSNKGLRSR